MLFPRIDPKEYRQLQLQSVTGYNGTTFTEIGYASMNRYYSLPNPVTKANFFLEFCMAIIPLIFSLTFAEQTNTFMMIYLTFILFSKSIAAKFTEKDRVNAISANRRPYLEGYRSFMMIMTIIGILAVDFTVFPRRFAKTETYGVSLMDLGVGGVVFSSAMTAAIPWLKSQSFVGRLKKSIQSCLPLLAIGMIRLVSVKGLDYQEHVSEYGVHWNFFFTLSIVPVFVAFVGGIFGHRFLALLGLIIAGVYEYFLCHGLEEYLFNELRENNLISMNKEGIFSLLGYIAIHLIGLNVGMIVLEKIESQSHVYKIAMKLVYYGVFMAFLLVGYFYYDLKISRRSANLGFVLWVAAVNIFMVLAFFLVDWFIPCNYRSVIIKAVNRNQLVVFLLGNLMTGCVNMTIQTLLVDESTGFLIILAYTGILLGLSVVLDQYFNLTLKFW